MSTMHYNKKFFYIFVFNAIVLSNIAPLQSMQRVEQDWEYKKREDKSICCLTHKDDQDYPHFFLEKTDSKTQCSSVLEQEIATKYNNIFNDTYDITSLDDENKKALWYVSRIAEKNKNLKIKELRIEGINKDFAQKMSQRVCNLPVDIKRKIAEKYGMNMICNTDYEPRLSDVIWDDEDNKNKMAYVLAGSGGCCCYWLQKWCCDAICPCEDSYNFCIDVRGEITVFCLMYLYNKVNIWFNETPEQKDKRHGFETIPLLKEMECKIVEAKEKID